jgi:hypothetical protein
MLHAADWRMSPALQRSLSSSCSRFVVDLVMSASYGQQTTAISMKKVFPKNGAGMTCRYSGTEWLDVLYTSVRKAPGGVADAANHLAHRRGKSITSETLRLRLRGEGENRLSMEMFELLLEWMQEKRESEPFALEALHALNERFGLIAVPRTFASRAADDDQPHDIQSLTTATLDLQAHVGEVATEVIRAVEDRRIDAHEAESLTVVSRKGQRLFEDLIRTAIRLSHLRRK